MLTKDWFSYEDICLLASSDNSSKLNVRQIYTDEIKKSTGYYPSWFPGNKVSVGDIGRITKSGYQHEANLKDLNIPYSVTSPRKIKTVYDHSSRGSVSTTTKLKGKTMPGITSIPINEAGFGLKFSKQSAIRFRAIGCRLKSIKNLIPIEHELIRRYRLPDSDRDKWPKNRVVIVEVVEAQGTTVIISQSKNAQIELSAGGKIGAGGLDLANAKIRFTTTFESGIETSFKTVAVRGLTPLFRTAGITDPFGRPPKVDWLKAKRKQKVALKPKQRVTLKLRTIKDFNKFSAGKNSH
jgi:hypothetical protein